MGHLTVNEILEFVSFTELNRKAVEHAAAVNGHIRCCEGCRKRVRTFQEIHDAFRCMNRQGDFKQYAADILSCETENEEKLLKMYEGYGQFNGKK